jgi:phosphoethanolamine N-methyltransferase
MQYAKDFAAALQFVWGDGFLSPGGPEEVAEMVAGIDLAGKRVLDVGSGLGGIDLLLAATHGAAEVVGIDVEPQLVDAARALVAGKGLSQRVRFQLVEPGPLPFPDASFDVVFSKDAMVHIEDKAGLYAEVLRVLKPGGWFTASDWLWAEGAAQSPVVDAWLSMGPLKFVFTPPAVALQAMAAAGFADARITDLRARLQQSNRKEIELLEGPARAQLAAVVGETMAKNRLASARGRQGALDSGDLIPSHLRGRRPSLAADGKRPPSERV